jgi:hypothetical protein
VPARRCVVQIADAGVEIEAEVEEIVGSELSARRTSAQQQKTAVQNAARLRDSRSPPSWPLPDIFVRPALGGRLDTRTK